MEKITPKVLVCGGRDFSNRNLLEKMLDELVLSIGAFEVVEGGAAGADFLAKAWAIEHDLVVHTYPAKWKKYGHKIAGPIRNQEMLDMTNPIIVVAFPTENSIGTYDMIRRSGKYRSVEKIIIIDKDGNITDAKRK